MRFLSVTCIAVCLSVVSIIVSTTVVIGVSTTFAITATNSLGRRLSTTVVKSTNDRVRELLDLAVNHEAGLRFGFYSGVYPNIQLNQSREAVLPFLRTMSPSIEESASKLLYIGAGFEDKSTIYCKVVDATETLCSLGDAQNLTTANGKTFKVITLLHFTNHTYTGADYTVSNFDPRGRDWYADVFSTSPHTLAGVNTSVNAIDTPVTVCRHSPSTFPDTLIRSLARTSAVSSVIVPKVDAKATASDPSAAQEASLSIQEVSLNSGEGDDEAYYVGIAPVSSSAPLLNLHWRLVTAVPKRDFLDEISKGRSLAIGLAGVVAMCSSVLCTLLLWRLLLPLGRIAHEMTQAATFRDQDIKLHASTSWLRDIFAIEDAFATLILQLTVARSFLPSSLLAQLNAESLSSNFAGGSQNEGRAHPEILLSGSSVSVSVVGGVKSEDEGPLLLSNGTAPTPAAANRSLVHSVSGATSLFSERRRPPVSAEIGPFVGSPDASFDDTDSAGGSDVDMAEWAKISEDVGNNAAQNPTMNDVFASKAKVRRRSHSAGHPSFPHEAPMSIHLHARTRTVSVVATNLAGFHSAVKENPALLGNAYAKWVDFVSSTAALHKGVLDSFQGDHCVITFNAAIACGPHASSAVTVAGTLAQHTSLTLQAGVSTGSAFVGNFGSTRSRRFGQIGTAVPNAVLLARLVRLLPPEAKASVVMGRAVAEDTEHVAQSLYFDVLEVASESQQQSQQSSSDPPTSSAATVPASPTEPKRAPSMISLQPIALLFALLGPQTDPSGRDGVGVGSPNEEWMYELAASQKASPDAILVDRLNVLFKKALHARLRSRVQNVSSCENQPHRARSDLPTSPPTSPRHAKNGRSRAHGAQQLLTAVESELSDLWKCIHASADSGDKKAAAVDTANAKNEGRNALIRVPSAYASARKVLKDDVCSPALHIPMLGDTQSEEVVKSIDFSSDAIQEAFIRMSPRSASEERVPFAQHPSEPEVGEVESNHREQRSNTPSGVDVRSESSLCTKVPSKNTPEALSETSRLRPLAVQTATCIARLVSGGPVTMPLGLFFDQCLMPPPTIPRRGPWQSLLLKDQ